MLVSALNNRGGFRCSAVAEWATPLPCPSSPTLVLAIDDSPHPALTAARTMADVQPDALGLDCAVSAVLPGVSSTHDSLSTYEAATGFRSVSPQRTPRATFRKLNADGTVDLDALHAAWSGHVGRLLSRDDADLLPVQGETGGGGLDDVCSTGR
jgi:hypothetical protein